MKKVWDVKAPKAWWKKKQLEQSRRKINKFFRSLETRGGMVGGKAVLFVKDDTQPELSYILTEKL